jgi:hypothetical protein
MLRWLPPQQLSDSEFNSLVRGAAPGGWTELDVAEKLLSGNWQAYGWDGGTLAVCKQGNRMLVTSFTASRFHGYLQAMRDVVDRLATDFMCDTVETTVFDERMAKAMMRMRGQVESWTLTWQVEGMSNGH